MHQPHLQGILQVGMRGHHAQSVAVRASRRARKGANKVVGPVAIPTVQFQRVHLGLRKLALGVEAAGVDLDADILGVSSPKVTAARNGTFIPTLSSRGNSASTAPI